MVIAACFSHEDSVTGRNLVHIKGYAYINAHVYIFVYRIAYGYERLCMCMCARVCFDKLVSVSHYPPKKKINQ